ncbi:VanZ family protein [Blautia sp.]|uniref:VanZ family protein n=1 Tax=Blautia sp. TaxID=1955243 RepID=UPI003AB708EB
MYAIVDRICVNIISSLYQYLFVSLVMAALFMLLYTEWKKSGIKTVLHNWINDFKNSKEYRKIYVLAVYTCLILFRTIFCRQIWGNPIGNVLGNWSFRFSDGTLSTELIENIFLFIPFSMLILWAIKDKALKGKSGLIRICYATVKISFLFSFSIELCQIILRVGTFQISDLVTNTLGGLIGGIIYWGCCKFKLK